MRYRELNENFDSIEPVIRVMLEFEDTDTCEQYIDQE